MALELADTPLYIVVAILVAIAAITTGELRDDGSPLPKRTARVMSMILMIGAEVSIFHIIVSMLSKNDFAAMSCLAVVEFTLHALALFILLILVLMWYWAVGIYKETSAGLPKDPAAEE